MLGLQEITYSNEAGERAAGSVLIEVAGNTRAILLAERTSLNFLGHLSGIATLTHSWVKEVTGTHCKIRDTRKTTPGYRALEKYAVRMGGGTNHRMSLSDAALIKDNHISASGDIVAALNAVRSNHPKLDMEIEVDSLDQLEQVLSLKPQLVLLDNMPAALCAKAVKLVAGAFQLEASGGIGLAQAAEFAQTGIDYIAVGALTHSAPVLDIGLDFIESSEEK
jgi:nicotinate-nucleotide pyrophosphorylase (carboxylating)